MRENEIRPDHLRGLQEAAYARDIERILARRDEFVEVDCPACGEDKRRVEFEKFSLTFQRCLQCRTVYTSPRPSPAVLDYYYQTSENYLIWNEHIFPASEEARRTKIFRPRVEKVVADCARFGISMNRLVDVGAGFGTFLEEMRTNGSFDDLVGVEPTPSLAESCKARGLQVVEAGIESVGADLLTADVVTAFEVIEHLYDPAAFLRACSRLLRPGGMIVITCPNVDGFDIMTLRERSATVDLEHLNYFTPRSLAVLLERVGFRIRDVSTPGVLDAELVRKAALRGEIALDGQPFLRTVLLERWEEVGDAFQSFLAASRLSSHLWVEGTLG
ncbi:MAG: class I SAM-dependent methyltransferase [Actinomycetota bacterium]|nr:class I SAM-dependent methyltransferase [Actinomycetota bacterium]